MNLGWFVAKLTPLLYTSWHFFVKYFENFRHWFPPAGVASASELLSWIANWSYQKKMDILRVVDRSVTLWEEPWRERFEKYWKSWNFRDFWWSLTNSGGGRSGCGLEIWTYILFGSISTRSIQILKNLGWSGGRLVKILKNSARGSGACAAWGPLFALRSAVAEHKPKVRSKAMPEACEYVRNSLFLVPSIDYATTMKPTSKSW